MDHHHPYRAKSPHGSRVIADLAVEIDGGIHQQQVEYDLERDQVLTGLDIRTLHFSNENVRNHLDQVLEKIRSACLSSAHLLPGPSPSGKLSCRNQAHADIGSENILGLS